MLNNNKKNELFQYKKKIKKHIWAQKNVYENLNKKPITSF